MHKTEWWIEPTKFMLGAMLYIMDKFIPVFFSFLIGVILAKVIDAKQFEKYQAQHVCEEKKQGSPGL